jgi:hypothetical protein
MRGPGHCGTQEKNSRNDGNAFTGRVMLLFDGIHLASDESPEELIIEALSIGLNPNWIQESRSGIIHFDVFGSPAKRLTVNCTRRDLVKRAVRYEHR